MSTFDLRNLDTQHRQKHICDYILGNIDDFLAKHAMDFASPVTSLSANSALGPDGKISEAYAAHIKACILYNSLDGKMIRGILCADTFLTTVRFLFPGLIEDPSQLIAISDVSVTLALAMEVLQASFLVADDVIDHSALRRSKKAWRKVTSDEQGLLDSIMLLTFADHLVLSLEKRTGRTFLLSDIYEQTKRLTLSGQHLDSFGLEGISALTKASVTSIHIMKTAYYTFVLPVLLGYRCGVLFGNKCIDDIKGSTVPQVGIDKGTEELLLTLSVKLGLLFQMEDDYLDVFNPAMLKKEGSDIREGKASWVYVRCLDLAREMGGDRGADILSYLALGYGKADCDVDGIKARMLETGIQGVFLAEARSLYDECKSLIARLPDQIGLMFTPTMEIMYERFACFLK